MSSLPTLTDLYALFEIQRKEIHTLRAQLVAVTSDIRSGTFCKCKEGKHGMDGKDGRDGLDGKNGLDGEPGLHSYGSDGRDGRDDRIIASAIAGLQNSIAALKENKDVLPIPSLEAQTEVLIDRLAMAGPVICSICLVDTKDCRPGCGHCLCSACSHKVTVCPTCREIITVRDKIYL